MEKKTKKTKTEKAEFNFRELNTFAKICIADGTTEEAFNKKWPESKFDLDTIFYEKNKMITRVINNGWKPDYKNTSQQKWECWSRVLPSGVGFVRSDSFYDRTLTLVGVRLVFECEEKANFFIETFEKERIGFLL